MNIGIKIKELRTEKGVSQATVAEAVGVNKRAVIFWEQGVNEPKASYIARLATYFEVSSDYLLGLKEY